MLSEITVSVASGLFSVVSFVRFLALSVLSHCTFLLHHSQLMSRHAQALQYKSQPQNKENILLTVFGFPIGKRVTNYYSILVSEAVGFSQELLPP